MQEMIRENLKKVISEILETMFFMFPEPWEGEEAYQELGRETLEGRIALGGEGGFGIHIYLSVPLAKKMAANFLGCKEEELSDVEIRDVVREAVNMLAGNLLNTEESLRRLEMSIPEVLEGKEGVQWKAKDEVILVVEGYPLIIRVGKTQALNSK